jgi:hypothetical protein
MAHIVFNHQLVSYIIFVISMCLCVYVSMWLKITFRSGLKVQGSKFCLLPLLTATVSYLLALVS